MSAPRASSKGAAAYLRTSSTSMSDREGFDATGSRRGQSSRYPRSSDELRTDSRKRAASSVDSILITATVAA